MQSCGSIAAPQSHPDTEGQALLGHYIVGHEANSFQPCGEESVYWVVGSREILGSMTEQYNNLTTKPYDEVFVKISGVFLKKATDGFAADYDGQIRVTKLFFMKKKSVTDCKR